MSSTHLERLRHVRYAAHQRITHLRIRRSPVQLKAGGGRAGGDADGDITPDESAGTAVGVCAVRAGAARRAADTEGGNAVCRGARRAAGRRHHARRSAAAAQRRIAVRFGDTLVRGAVAGAAPGALLSGVSALSGAPGGLRRGDRSAARRQRGRGGALQRRALSRAASGGAAGGKLWRLRRAGAGRRRAGKSGADHRQVGEFCAVRQRLA